MVQIADEGPQLRAQVKDAARNMDGIKSALIQVPVTDAFGTPLVEISTGCYELIPTQAYGNVMVGPVMIRRWVPDGDEEHLAAELSKISSVCENAIAEDRQTVHNLLRQSRESKR